MLKSNLLNTLKTRGFINDCTDLVGLDNVLNTSKITCYIGYDATASFSTCRTPYEYNDAKMVSKDEHRVITFTREEQQKSEILLFRKTERPLIDDKTIDNNLQSLKSIFSKYIKFSSNLPDALMLNNDEWLNKLNYLSFLGILESIFQ